MYFTINGMLYLIKYGSPSNIRQLENDGAVISTWRNTGNEARKEKRFAFLVSLCLSLSLLSSFLSTFFYKITSCFFIILLVHFDGWPSLGKALTALSFHSDPGLQTLVL